MLYAESLLNNRQFVFLTHPNEFIDEERDEKPIESHSSNPINHLIRDIIRHALKLRNLGEKALPLLEHELRFFSDKKIEFITCSELLDRTANRTDDN